MPVIARVIPILVYEDLSAAHDFLVRAFGFAAAGDERNAAGQAIHGEVRAGDTTIWLHRLMPKNKRDSLRTIEIVFASCAYL